MENINNRPTPTADVGALDQTAADTSPETENIATQSARLDTMTTTLHTMRHPSNTSPLTSTSPALTEPNPTQNNFDRSTAQKRASEKLDLWVQNCPNQNEQTNWKAVAQQMKSEGVYLTTGGRYVIEGDLFANDFTGLVAPHSPLSLPEDLTVTGTLDLNFFGGLQTLPRGLIVGKKLILTGIQEVLARTPHPIIENGHIINRERAPA